MEWENGFPGRVDFMISSVWGKQSVPRAELTGTTALSKAQCAEVWADASYVVNGCKELRSYHEGSPEPGYLRAGNSDLWAKASQMAVAHGWPEVCKIKAHVAKDKVE